MLSYRHAFHAGNFADLLKHIIQLEILEYLCQKDKPFDYIDTHAGAGLYALDGEFASKNKEYQNGIGHWLNDSLSNQSADQKQWPDLESYLTCIKQFNPDQSLQFYPGSPAIAANLIRPQDKAWLHELHPADFELLQHNFDKRRQIKVRQQDGFKALQALLPCQSRRALVLIDPSYEIKADYQQVVDNVIKAHRKMTNAVFAIWYPVVERSRINKMLADFADSGITNIQQFELGIRADSHGFGMTSAGMIVINPPWTLISKMEKLLPRLARLISQDSESHYQCRVLVEES